MMWSFMNIYFSKYNKNNHVLSNDSDDFLGMCDPPDVEPGDISEANPKYYSEIGVVQNKGSIEIFPTTNSADGIFWVRAETEYGGRNNEFTLSGSGILCETKYLLVRKHHGFCRSKSEK